MVGTRYTPIRWLPFAAALLSACGATQDRLENPGVTLEPTAPAIASSAAIAALPSAELLPPAWQHVDAVSSWPEAFRGTSSGHPFEGASNATVSTRISEPALADVLEGSATWRDMRPGASVSQLVFEPASSTTWSVAYVAERIDGKGVALAPIDTRSTDTGPNESTSLVAFYLVSPLGVIDASQHQLCASCHAQRGH